MDKKENFKSGQYANVHGEETKRIEGRIVLYINVLTNTNTNKEENIMFAKINDLLFPGSKRGGRKISFVSLLTKIDIIIDKHGELYKWGQRFNSSRKDQIKFFDPSNPKTWIEEIIPELQKYYMINRIVIRTNPKNQIPSILINYKKHLIKEG